MHPCGCKGLNQLWIYLATAKVAVKHSLVMLRNLGCIRLESTTIIRTNTCFLVAQKDVLCLSNISEQIARLWCAWTTLVSDTGSNSSCRHREDKKNTMRHQRAWAVKIETREDTAVLLKRCETNPPSAKNKRILLKKTKAMPSCKENKWKFAFTLSQSSFTSSTLRSMGPCTCQTNSIPLSQETEPAVLMSPVEISEERFDMCFLLDSLHLFLMFLIWCQKILKCFWHFSEVTAFLPWSLATWWP